MIEGGVGEDGKMNRGSGGSWDRAWQPPANKDQRLVSETLQVERKTFVFALMENDRGQFLRITEGASGRRNHIIIPATGLADFRRVIAAMAEESGDAADGLRQA